MYQYQYSLLRLFVGAGHGLAATTIYTSEVVSKELRGSLEVFQGVTRSFGMILTYALGAFFPWYSLPYIGLLPPIAAFILLLNSPESPVYLVSKGEIPGAEKSLARLNNEKFDVAREIKEIMQGLERCKENNSQARNKTEVVKNIKNYPEVYKPFLIITFLR